MDGRYGNESVTETPPSPCTEGITGSSECLVTSELRTGGHRATPWQCRGHGFESRQLHHRLWPAAHRDYCVGVRTAAHDQVRVTVACSVLSRVGQQCGQCQAASEGALDRPHRPSCGLAPAPAMEAREEQVLEFKR